MRRLIIVGLILLEASGCKHVEKKKDQPWPILVPPVPVETKEEPRTKTVSIVVLKIDNLTIKAW